MTNIEDNSIKAEYSSSVEGHAKAQCEEERIVAVLHDVVEDTDVTLNELRVMGFDERIVIAVDYLTKRDGLSFLRLKAVKRRPVRV